MIAAGGSKTCVVLDGSKLRCWGRNDHGRLGFALPDNNYGDDEPASAVPLLDLGDPIAGLSLDTSTACLTSENGELRCWGGGTVGSLGILWQGWLGDDETILDGQPVDLGGARVVQIAAGSSHACALFEDATVKCWGYGGEGALGYGNLETLCDEAGEEPKNLPAVDIGSPVRAIFAGDRNTCAVLQNGGLKCWGHEGYGKLGLGSNELIGDDETPASVEAIQLAGGPVVRVATQGRQICALHEEGSVSCWGETGPWLGYGKAMDSVGLGLGDDEHPSELGVVNVGGKVLDIVVGDAFTCARLEMGSVKCWGASNLGQLGYGNTNYIGYDETPAEVAPIELGGAAISLVAGWDHACVLLDDDSIRCWGLGIRLGYGNPQNVGDDETPAQAGPVPFH